MAKVYYVGDWAIMLGRTSRRRPSTTPGRARTSSTTASDSFHARSGTLPHFYPQPFPGLVELMGIEPMTS